MHVLSIVWWCIEHHVCPALLNVSQQRIVWLSYRYAGLLEASMEHSPTVIGLEPSELLDFCNDSNYSYRVEGDGSLLVPPHYYVGITDWERSNRLR